MSTNAAENFTSLLAEAAAGNETAKQAIFVLVYEELHRMAHNKMKAERAGHTWNTTGLLHEAYFRLMRGPKVFTENRSYFFGAAANAMYQLLREYARKKKSRVHGNLHPNGYVLIDEIAASLENDLKLELSELIDAIEKLKTVGRHGERKYQVVKLRFYGGLTYKEIAEDLQIAPTTVEKDWLASKAWLHQRLKGRSIDGGT